MIEDQAARVRLILFDVDGVLTDGKVLLHADGTESKVFDIKDGTGIVWAQRLGLTVGFLSARSSAVTAQRAAQLGMTCVVDRDDDTLLGIITDGDLRRRMERGGEILGLTAGDVMSRHPVSVPRATLAAEALNIMEQRKITSIVVADDGLPVKVAGVLHLHDLWRMDMF